MGAHSTPRRHPVRRTARATAWLAVKVCRGARWVLGRLAIAASKTRSWLDRRLPPAPDLRREPLSAQPDLYPPPTIDEVSRARPDLNIPVPAAASLTARLAVQPTGHTAIALLHAHLDLGRDRIKWRVLDDGAYGEVCVLEGSVVEHREIVCECAAAFGVDMQEREPAESGYGTVTASGEFAGVHLAVAAPILPDVSDALNTFTETAGDPSLAEPTTQQFEAIRLEGDAEAVDAA